MFMHLALFVVAIAYPEKLSIRGCFFLWVPSLDILSG